MLEAHRPTSTPPTPVIAVVSHVLNPGVRAVLDRLRHEAPPDHEVRMVLSADDPAASLAGLAETEVERISRA